MKTYHEDRPWGSFDKFCENEKCTVKIIDVKPGKKLSLQYHYQREEFWRIISGKAKILIGDKIFNAKEGDEFFIPLKVKHRIMTEKDDVKILEISLGHFDEEDIVRLEDEYNRV